MRILAIFGDANNQCALANRIHKIAPLSHIARVRLIQNNKRRIFTSLASRSVGLPLHRSWQNMLRFYGRHFSGWPVVPQSLHSSANDEGLADLVERANPDLILVSGTDIIKERTLQRFPSKVMNLHTGISPYIKGGPNCTNWALSLREFDLIGNTVMWIDPGIDSGSIIATERTPLNGDESLTDLHVKVMDHAHHLYCRAIRAYTSHGHLRSVPQEAIDTGRVFYSGEWDWAAISKAVINYLLHYGRQSHIRSNIRLVDLRLMDLQMPRRLEEVSASFKNPHAPQ